SRAYLHHLARPGEILASMLLTHHNLRYYARLMEQMRAAIEARQLAALGDCLTRDWARGDR
ncbi:MAG: tRNA guanosine(34) transglycosylase Tgt, partial [Stellaceae bacterium]